MNTITQRSSGNVAHTRAAEVIAARLKQLSNAYRLPLVGTGNGTAIENPPGEPQNPPIDEPKSYTQAQLDAMFADRIARSKRGTEAAHQKQLEEEREKARKEGEERAAMSAAERAQAELADERKKFDAEREQVQADKLEAIKFRRMASLEAHVTDANAALKLLEDEHLTETGSVDTEKFLKAFPFLRKSKTADPTDPSNPSPKGEKPDFSKMSKDEFEKYKKRVSGGEKITP